MVAPDSPVSPDEAKAVFVTAKKVVGLSDGKQIIAERAAMK
jgi:hypothetical protein